MASIALALLSPILLAAAGFIRLLMGKPIITVQERIGFGGRAFASYKFRTSIEDCGDSVALWRANPSLAVDLADAMCKTGLDKQPQLINVLRGDMSLIGPRPIAAAEF
jgi:undecaprenyl-phosphate galactose phosphotransferase/putative colanic acid biosynthesis UDP-glucose lipid carrier transferase